MKNDTSPTQNEIRALMSEGNLTYADLANLLSVQKSTVGFWLAGPSAKHHSQMPIALFRYAKLAVEMKKNLADTKI